MTRRVVFCGIIVKKFVNNYPYRYNGCEANVSGEVIMNYFLFFLFSMLECFAVFLLICVLFRRKVSDKIFSILYMSLGMTLISYFFRFDLGVDNLAIIAQMAFVIASIILIWNTQWFYAGIMTIIGYSSYLLIQGFCVLLLNIGGVMTFTSNLLDKQTDSVTLIGYLIQTISVIVSSLVAGLIWKNNLGWSFVPYGEKSIQYSEPTNKYLIMLMIMTLLVFGSIVLLSGMGGTAFFVVVLVFAASILGLLYHLSNKKEMFEDD